MRLGREARMNTPAVPEGNWRWRLSGAGVTDEYLEELADINITYDRARSL